MTNQDLLATAAINESAKDVAGLILHLTSEYKTEEDLADFLNEELTEDELKHFRLAARLENKSIYVR